MLAVLVAFSYALIKFLTSLHMRRLRDQQARCMLDLEEKYKMTQAAALGGEGKQDR
ncbi:MAG: hypothetical protein VCE12_02840 [Candidatus Latescibacterota bacterium]|nr:hypothetical protein [Candidatus Latescibacterota bacterium]